jgi:hypothetical protein
VSPPKGGRVVRGASADGVALCSGVGMTVVAEAIAGTIRAKAKSTSPMSWAHRDAEVERMGAESNA